MKGRPPLRSHRDLIAWQKAMRLVDLVLPVARAIGSRPAGLASQIERAVISVPTKHRRGIRPILARRVPALSVHRSCVGSGARDAPDHRMAWNVDSSGEPAGAPRTRRRSRPNPSRSAKEPRENATRAKRDGIGGRVTPRHLHPHPTPSRYTLSPHPAHHRAEQSRSEAPSPEPWP